MSGLAAGARESNVARLMVVADTDTRGILRGLMIIAAAAVCLRVAFVLWVPNVPVADARSCYQRAANLVDHGRYEAVPGRVDATFPPAYPTLLAPVFAVASDRLLAAKLLNCLLGGLSVLLVGLLARQLFGRKVGFAAAVILAVYPRAVVLPALVASENLALPLLLLWVWLFVRDRGTSPYLSATVAGAVLGVLSLTRAVAYLLWIVWTMATGMRRHRWGSALAATALLVLVQHLVMAPWAYRNARAFGEANFLTSVGGVNLFIRNNAQATGEWYPWSADMEVIDEGFRGRSVMDQDRAARRAAVAWITTHPGEAAALYLRKWRVMFQDERDAPDAVIYHTAVTLPWPASDALPTDHVLKRQRQLVYAVLDVPYFVLSTLELLGVFFWASAVLRRDVVAARVNALFLCGSALYFPAVAAVFLAATRFRWPATDLLIPVAAFFLCRTVSGRNGETGR